MTTRTRLLFCCALTAAALLAPAANAATITTASGANGADTHVSNDTNQASTTNHGAATTNAIRNLAATRRKLMYVRFDLSTISGDRSAATLSFYFANANRVRTMNVYGLADDATDDAWAEGSMTYETAPGIQQPADGGVAYNSGDASIDLAKLTLLGTFATPGANATDLTTSVASLDLDSFLSADTNDLVTFVLDVSATDNNASYFVATKENAGANGELPPRLTLPNAVPEPASLTGLAFGFACMALSRRRG